MRLSSELAERLEWGLRLWSIALSSEDDDAARAALDEMVTAYHEDAELDFSRTLPDFAPIRGRNAMVTWSLNARHALRRSVALEPAGELTVVGDTVVFPVRMSAHGAASGLPMETEFAYVFRFRGDKIASAMTYPALPEALRAAKESRQA